MRVSLIQSDIAWNDPGENARRGRALAEQAASQGGELLVFPEMFTCGFSMPKAEGAAEANAVGCSFLREVAETFGVYSVGSLPEIGEGGALFNTAYLYRPDGTSVAYRKIHLFSYGDETKWYSAGDATLTVDIRGVRCSLFICYDLRFTLPFYKTADSTDLFVVMANWPTPRREHWLTLLRARAIECQSYVAGVNRVGSGGGLGYSGDSVLIGPDGSLLGQLGPTEEVFTGDVQPNTVASWRETFPALRDRKPEVYRNW